MIRIKDLTKLYGRTAALSGISMDIRPGEIIGLFGPNGAGKTTLIKSVFGFVNYQGSITLGGEPITRKNIARMSFGTCEHSFFPGIDAKDHAEFYRDHFRTFDERRFNVLMDFFELPMNVKIRHFSTGQQNQFEVIMALCQGADYIFLDEPFAGNDIFNREDFYKVLLGMLGPEETLLLSTHLIEEVSGLVSRAVLLNNGKIIGDKQIADLDEEGTGLVDYIKNAFSYKADRVFQALEQLSPEGK
ncbi:MAG: ABC transporter ATP-binding protein [Firmicutes bacterium]|nr:ABC transporter ATP-binding protein [Bacillota bacterium]